MAVSYLGSTSPITAERWNVLFSELDTKIRAVWDNKTPLILPVSQTFEVLGKIFLFAPAETDRVYTADLPVKIYDHSHFTDAVAATDPLTDYFLWDEDKHIALLKDGFDQALLDEIAVPGGYRLLDQSLQTHTVTIEDVVYYILDPTGEDTLGVNGFIPERRWKYAQAEIVIEGQLAVDFDVAWDKFNFFRIHNLNDTEAEVTFPGPFIVTVPPWGIQCVRRDNGAYTLGYRYLQKMRSGDPRMLHFRNGTNSVSTFNTPWGSMGSNNAFSVAICHDWISRMTQVGGWDGLGPQAYADPEELRSIAGLHSGVYPTIANDVSIGSLLHHEGDLLDVRINNLGDVTTKTIRFNGYDTFEADMLLEGIIATKQVDGSWTLLSGDDEAIQHDLWGVGTNLLCILDGVLGFQQRPGVSIKTAVTLANHGPNLSGARVIRPLIQESEAPSYTWDTLGAETGGSVPLDGTDEVTVGNARSAAGLTGFATGALQMSDWDVNAIKGLTKWEHSSYLGASLSNLRSTLSNQAVTLTPYGVVLSWRENASLNYRLNIDTVPYVSMDAETISAIEDNQIREVTSTALVFSRSTTFDQWGWPTAQEPAFLSPRRPFRHYAVPQEVEVFVWDDIDEEKQSIGDYITHPNVLHELENTDGEDWQLDPVWDKIGERVAVQAICPVQLSSINETVPGLPEPFIFQGYRAPDIFDELLEHLDDYVARRAAWMANEAQAIRIARLPLVREYYDAIAQRVNAMTKCRPFHFEDWVHQEIGSGARLLPNTLGPFGGPYCPANQYCSFEQDSIEWQICVKLGIPILTEDDLPDDYQILKSTSPKTYSVTTDYDQTYELTNTEDLGTQVRYTYDITRSIGVTDLEIRTESEGDLLDPAIFEGSGDEEFFWCSIEDVKSAAEAHGFVFWLERLVLPYQIKVFQMLETPTVLWTSAEEQGGFFFQETLDKVWNGSEFVNPPSKDGLVETVEEEPFINTTGQANPAQMTHCISGETPTWIRARDLSVRLQDYRAGDQFTVRRDLVAGFSNIIVQMGFGAGEYRYLRQVSDFIRHPENDISPAIIRTPTLYHQSMISSVFTRGQKVILHDIQSVKHTTETFSVDDYVQAIARLQHGNTVLPLELVSASESAPSSVGSMNTAANMITPPDAEHAYEALLFVAWPMVF